jgi:uncharacterized damage-inducible protein DinB
MMDLLDRLLQHDLWTTQQLLERYRELTPAQRTQSFDIGHQTLDATFQHMLGNVRVWTDLMLERPVQTVPERPAAPVDELIAAWNNAYWEFAALARQITAEGRMDDTFLDVLDQPPRPKSFGGAIAHVITHNMQHRGEMMHMLARLDVPNIIEGDVLSWEHQARSNRDVTEKF